ncbi:MAG: hypothetical protein CMF43_01140 [Legionellales bacterium]|nr:hypothetical protein [Legionellales bacterium]
MLEHTTTPPYAEVIQVNHIQESTLADQQAVHASPVELATQINDAEYLNSHESTGDDEIQNAQAIPDPLVSEIRDICLQLRRVFEQSEARERQHRIFEEKFINLHRTVFANADLSILLIFYLASLANGSMCSGAGAAMLENQFHSYKVQEAVWVVLIGSSILCPFIIYGTRYYAQMESPPLRYRDAAFLSNLAQGFLIPNVGYQILKYCYNVEMTIWQHIAALWLGGGTLFLPLSALEIGVMYMCNREYLHRVEAHDDGAHRADDLISEHGAAHTSRHITNDQHGLSNIVSDEEQTASDPDQLVESEAIRCIL